MKFVKDLRNTDLPIEFLQVLPTVCPFCGADTEITDTLTSLSCTNPFCRSKLTERMVGMLADLGVKNLGAAKCEKFIETYEVKSPYALFEFSKRDGTAKNVLFNGCSKEFSDSIAVQVNDKRSKLLWEYVKIGNFPGIRDSAKKLFQGYNDINSFYKDMEDKTTGGIEFITKLLGIKSEDSKYKDLNSDITTCSIKAVEIFRTLTQVKAELLHYEKFFDIQKIGKSINICISTSVGKPYTSKSDFVDKMNKKYGNQIHINQLSSVSKQCDVLIWSKQGSATSKVEKAHKNNIPIVTGIGFDTIMQGYVNGEDLNNLCKIIQDKEDLN